MIDRLETPFISKRPKLPFDMPTDVSFMKNKAIKGDHRLNNWRQWLERRRRKYQTLDEGGSENRQREIVITNCEKIRPEIEVKNLMEHATISTSMSDKHPRFQKVPLLVSNRRNFCSRGVVPMLTKKDAGAPVCIKDEKYYLSSSRSDFSWKRGSHMRKQKEELSGTAPILQHSIPDNARSIARGQGLDQQEEHVLLLPVISIDNTSLGHEDSKGKVQDSPVSPSVVVTLKINNFEITRDEKSIHELLDTGSENITWNLNFVNKTNQISTKFLRLENKGTVAITYQWRNVILTSRLLPLSLENHANFFFNKNKSLILPGQKVLFPVWFKTHQCGMFSESWHLQTDPIVSRVALIIRMCGYAAVENFDTTELEVDVYLDRCIRNTIVREIIDEIIDDGKSSECREPAYKSLYLEKNLFQAKNPSYFYHASVVTELYQLYATASASDAPSWTLSLIDLRNILLRIENSDLRQDRLKVFSDLCHQCLGVCLFHPVRNTKYAMVYNILCAVINRMEEESDFVKRNSVPTNERSTSMMETQIRSSSSSSLATRDTKPLLIDLAFYREVFYVRIYELIVEAIDQACAIIDSLNNLNDSEP